MRRVWMLLPALCVATLAMAQEQAPLGDAEKQELLERARGLHERAASVRQQAADGLARAEKACWQKFLVTACLDEARAEKRAREAEAREFDRQARTIEREVKQREFAQREAQRLEDAPRRATEASERAEQNRRAQEEALRRKARKQAEGR